MTTAQGARTPGYNCRLMIFFATDKRGRRVAYRWSGDQIRAFRMALADAELFIATEQADELHCHPLRYCATCAANTGEIEVR